MPNKDKLIAVKPIADPANRFVELFSGAIAGQGYEICEFNWQDLDTGKADAAILHWPYELLGLGGWRGIPHWRALYKRIQTARAKGTKIVWVAHNAQPHEGGWLSPLLMRHFIRSIDAIIHLSSHSRILIDKLYAPPPRVLQMETVHGHYLDVMETPLKEVSRSGKRVRLAYFGQIRGYKNVEALARLVARMTSDVSLSISGLRSHESVAAELEKIAEKAPNIHLDIRKHALPNAGIERCVDEADAVVLPYQNILNSGAAIFALSRARPVLAPNIGSLPELQVAVGREWIQLYDGAISFEILENFVHWLNESPKLHRPDLSRLSWTHVGEDIAALLDNLLAR